MSEKRYPLPPFDEESAREKVRLAEDAWNSKNPEFIAHAYSEDSEWRNRDQFLNGREEIVNFLKEKWTKESHYKLVKELWSFFDNFIAVRFEYEWFDQEKNSWFRAYGNENWQFNSNGLMEKRQASINDVEIKKEDLKFTWKNEGPRPKDFPGLSELELLQLERSEL